MWLLAFAFLGGQDLASASPLSLGLWAVATQPQPSHPKTHQQLHAVVPELLPTEHGSSGCPRVSREAAGPSCTATLSWKPVPGTVMAGPCVVPAGVCWDPCSPFPTPGTLPIWVASSSWGNPAACGIERQPRAWTAAVNKAQGMPGLTDRPLAWGWAPISQKAALHSFFFFQIRIHPFQGSGILCEAVTIGSWANFTRLWVQELSNKCLCTKKQTRALGKL